MSPTDTIAAIATAPGPGAVGIVRVAGPQAGAIASSLFQSAAFPGYAAVPDRTLHLGTFRAADGRVLDRGLLLVMRGPDSYTGDDIAEFHCHGGTAAVGAVLAAALAAGARAAAPGEFTRRAFLAGKLDLVRAEAVAALVGARTRTAAALAAAQHAGSLSRWLAQLRAELESVRVELTHRIDVAEDGPDDAAAGLADRVAALLAATDAVRRRGAANLRALTGLDLAITGPPNAGKSSLFNRLLDADRAIVTPVPGTTRDPLHGELDLGGVPVRLVDTAGWSDAADPVGAAAEARRRAAVAGAGLTLVVFDGSAPPPDDGAAARFGPGAAPTVAVLTKADLPPAWSAADRARHWIELAVSARTGAGIDLLQELLAARIAGDGLEPEAPGAVTDRQQSALDRARDDLARLRDGIAAGAGAECLLIEVRAALQTVGELTGETASGAIIDRVFERFCVGK